MIAFESVTHRYRASAAPALDGVTIAFAAGELTAIVGANGSGKSTLARLCDGLLLPTAGRVLVEGLDTADPVHLWDIRALVGMVFQDPDDQIVGTVVEEDCAFGPENVGLAPEEIRRRVDESLAAVGLTGLERREPHLLSEGQKQRLAVAGAMAMRPRFLVLDEPTAMLDPQGRRSVMAVVEALAHESGHGVVLITHDASALSRVDRVVGLEAGRVVYDADAAGVLGDDALMARLGLELPPVGLLAAELRRSGLPVPLTALDAESVVAALWH